MISAQPQCVACTHLDRQAPTEPQCNAFPEGIPADIWTNRVLHTAGYPGDNGIHLELIPLDVLDRGAQA